MSCVFFSENMTFQNPFLPVSNKKSQKDILSRFEVELIHYFFKRSGKVKGVTFQITQLMQEMSWKIVVNDLT